MSVAITMLDQQLRVNVRIISKIHVKDSSKTKQFRAILRKHRMIIKNNQFFCIFDFLYSKIFKYNAETETVTNIEFDCCVSDVLLLVRLQHLASCRADVTTTTRASPVSAAFFRSSSRRLVNRNGAVNGNIQIIAVNLKTSHW